MGVHHESFEKVFLFGSPKVLGFFIASAYSTPFFSLSFTKLDHKS
jgi:hypothetical protein